MAWNIFHKKRTPKQVVTGIGNGGLTWEKRELPSGGATVYAFETYGTPVYDFALGNGAAVIRHPLRETSPAQWANFTAPIQPNPPLNTFQGQIATQPLVDPQTALSLGLVGAGAIPPGAYNVMPPSGPALAP